VKTASASPLTDSSESWTLFIGPKSRLLELKLGELWRYRDLIGLFVWRDFVSVYKQTILGPLWYVIQPLLTTVVFTIIFGKVAAIPTDGIPPVLFYMAGIVFWRYFSDCLTKTSNTFVGNAHIFGKVYFPRLTVPVSVVISNLIGLAIQLILFLAFWVYYMAQSDAIVFHPEYLALLPVLVVQMGILGLGFGIIVSSLTTKYRDLTQLVGFGVQLWMYATPIVYPMSMIPESWRWLVALNPMSPVIEIFKYSFLGNGIVEMHYWAVSLCVTAIVFIFGVILFNRVEKSFMDTV
jgi:lipopolysaccharide transport system permease protein